MSDKVSFSFTLCMTQVKETQELKFRGGGNISNWEANSDIDAINLSNGMQSCISMILEVHWFELGEFD